MNAIISYQEIAEQIEKKYNVRPNFSTVDQSTVQVSYKPNMLIPTIAIEFHIETASNNIVCLSYNCGDAQAFIISGAINLIKKKIPKGIEVNTSTRRINITPEQFKQARGVLEHINLSKITFNDCSANIEFSIK